MLFLAPKAPTREHFCSRALGSGGQPGEAVRSPPTLWSITSMHEMNFGAWLCPSEPHRAYGKGVFLEQSLGLGCCSCEAARTPRNLTSISGMSLGAWTLPIRTPPDLRQGDISGAALEAWILLKRGCSNPTQPHIYFWDEPWSLDPAHPNPTGSAARGYFWSRAWGLDPAQARLFEPHAT